ncbi:MAG: hypothetical protein MJY78_06970 [Fibrobacter sp.]|nr:hypothetical protein [Fibrobacter sp.]
MSNKTTLAELAKLINDKIGSKQRSKRIREFCKYRKERNEPLGRDSSVINQFKQYFKEAVDSSKDGKPHNNGRAFEILTSFLEFIEKEEEKIGLYDIWVPKFFLSPCH